MKHSPRFPRTLSNLSESCNWQLNAYALAAGAAGLGLLTLATPAEGEIVYTPANLPLMNQDKVFVDLNSKITQATTGHAWRTGAGITQTIHQAPEGFRATARVRQLVTRVTCQ